MEKIKHKPSMRQLQLLKALVETKSVTKVAEREHISQPSVSIQLKKMAELVDAELYHVNGKRIDITEAGMALYQCAIDIESSIERMHTQLAALNGLQAGTLRVAVVSTSQYFMSILLGPFCHRYPNIDVQLTIANRKEIIERLQSHRDDFYVFSHGPEDLDIVKEPFLENALVVVAPKRHELTRKSNISIQRLQHYPFIMREEGSGTRRTIKMFCREHNITLQERMSIRSNEAIKHAVLSGLGLAIISRHTIDYVNIEDLVILEVEHFPIVNTWYLAYPRQRKLSTLAQTFLEFMKSEGKALLNKKKLT